MPSRLGRAVKAWQVRTRLRAPGWLRRIYRSAQAFGPATASQELPQILLDSCRFVNSRNAILEALPHHANVVELGTLRGDFAREILARTDPSVLHIVDVGFDALYPDVAQDARVRCHKGLSHEVMGKFPDQSLDWVYVDADHSYAGTLRDAEAAAPKIRPGGFLIFNDFAHVDPAMGRYGVHRAAVDFALAAQWPFRFFAYEINALYDVALQKPATDGVN